MFAEIRLVYNRYFYWLAFFPMHWWSWREAFQNKFGNIFNVLAVGRNKLRVSKHFHFFHILAPSPWPVCVSISLLLVVSGILDFLNSESDYNLLLGFMELIFCLWSWWADVIKESLTEHTKYIKFGIAVGMLLFIVSEVMFFFSFFWAFFHVSVAPGIELGCVWPPYGLDQLVISPFGAPLLNTFILLISGVTVTCAHYSLLFYCYKQRQLSNFLNAFGTLAVLRSFLFSYKFRRIGGYPWHLIKEMVFSKLIGVFLEEIFLRIKARFYYRLLYNIIQDRYIKYSIIYFIFTLFLAIMFTVSQALEYVESTVMISDGVYGSTFFVMTGFHGFHVIIGTLFLFVCFFRILLHKYSFVNFIGLECAIWYWHFVDVVWLFLFIFVYIWGNGLIPTVPSFSFEGALADFATKFQFDFQDSASVLMEAIVDLHNYVMFYLLLILGIVTWMLFYFSFLNYFSIILIRFELIRHVLLDIAARELISRRLFFIFNKKFIASFKWVASVRDKNLSPAWRAFFARVEKDLIKAKFNSKR